MADTRQHILDGVFDGKNILKSPLTGSVIESSDIKRVSQNAYDSRLVMEDISESLNNLSIPNMEKQHKKRMNNMRAEMRRRQNEGTILPNYTNEERARGPNNNNNSECFNGLIFYKNFIDETLDTIRMDLNRTQQVLIGDVSDVLISMHDLKGHIITCGFSLRSHDYFDELMGDLYDSLQDINERNGRASRQQIRTITRDINDFKDFLLVPE